MINNINIVYFIGVGGIGMSALARYFYSKGAQVYGYDKTQTQLTKTLEQEGIAIHYDEDIKAIPPNVDLFVYTPAIPNDHLELRHIKEQGYDLYKRSEVLGMISEDSVTIAVAGTHGKTTTSALVAHILTHSGFGCNAFIGGILSNYDSNYLEDPSSDVVVVEADEFDRSFLHLKPDISVVTSVDLDHLDIYENEEDILEGFRDFLLGGKEDAHLILNENPAAELKLGHEVYGQNAASSFRLSNISYVNGRAKVLARRGSIDWDFDFGLPGKYNAENAMAAILVALKLGISVDKIKVALSSFKGIKRRFEVHFQNKGCIYIDDYAHHPTEIEAFLNAVRDANPEKRILGIFQPHLYSRTRDFMSLFAKTLSTLDELWLLPIYPAREEPIPQVTSGVLFDMVSLENKSLIRKEEVLERLESEAKSVILTIGAGDIDKLVPQIKQLLIRKYA
ncbi:MAG: UDP-N-acetylmuramate--L-alanine ligase [Flavobacteriales bacterium]|nr:UDP-N-acetylmuramate--L-alanine ligase [Flavobacteriales bacterium]